MKEEQRTFDRLVHALPGLFIHVVHLHDVLCNVDPNGRTLCEGPPAWLWKISMILRCGDFDAVAP
jgi:hypothetical protein